MDIFLIEADCWRAGSTTIFHMPSGLGVCFCEGQEKKKKGLDLFAVIQLSADMHLCFRTAIISAIIVGTDA